MQTTYARLCVRVVVGAVLVALALAGQAVAAPATDTGTPAGSPQLLQTGAGFEFTGGSDEVRELQLTLQRVGHSPGPIDGLFGPLTEAAVRSLQLTRGLTADGVVGPRTAATLSALSRQIAAAQRRRIAAEASRIVAARQRAALSRMRAYETPVETSPWPFGELALAAAFFALALAATLVKRRLRRSPRPVAPPSNAGTRDRRFNGARAALCVTDRGAGRSNRVAYLVPHSSRRASWAAPAPVRRLAALPRRRAAARDGRATPTDRGATVEQPHALGYATVNGTGRVGDAQLTADAVQINEYCEQRGWKLVELVRDSDSANGKPARPGLEYAEERLASGVASTLVVPRLEQLCRSVAELPEMIDRIHAVGGRLVCLEPRVDTGASAPGAAVLESLLAFSRWERERLAERTRKGLAAARAKNAASRRAIADTPELKQRIVAMRDDGMTLQAIADTLNLEGVPTLRGGKEWRPSSVQRTLRSGDRSMQGSRSTNDRGRPTAPTREPHTRRPAV